MITEGKLMKTLAIISQKGGVGKTTLATCLAVEAEREGKQVLVVDLDPQATATFWSDIRDKETPTVMSSQVVRLPNMIKAAEAAGTDLIIIDGAAVSRDIAFEASKAADFALIPFKAAVFDLNSVSQTVQMIKAQDTPFALLQTFAAPRGKETSEAAEIANDLEAPLSPYTIGSRKVFFRAQAQGMAVQELEPNGKAAKEIKSVYTYTCIRLSDEDMENTNVK